MSRREFRRFLLSGDAIQVHLLFGGLIVLLSWSILAGEAQPDFGWGLLFCIVVYPVVLGLMWCQKRSDEEFIAEHIEQSLTAPEQLRRKRRGWRQGFLVFFAAAALGFMYAGRKGMLINRLPAQYVGYFFMGMAVLGLAGVNIWYGGPFDPRLDPPPESDRDESESSHANTPRRP